MTSFALYNDYNGTYSYILQYISTEPVEQSFFPVEIDTGQNNGKQDQNKGKQDKNRDSEIKEIKNKTKKNIQKAKTIVIKNPIQFLEP